MWRSEKIGRSVEDSLFPLPFTRIAVIKTPLHSATGLYNFASGNKQMPLLFKYRETETETN